MTLVGLAFNSLRFRRGSFTATFVNVFFGAVVLMSFASLFDTAGGVGVSSADRSSLTTIAGAVGGWGLVIVGFGVSSTMNLSIRQRQPELALLKATGATPSQIGRVVIGEGATVSIVAALLGVIPAWLIGRAVLGALTATDQIAESVSYRFGTLALVAGLSMTLLATIGASAITARRAGRVSARDGVPVTRCPHVADAAGQGGMNQGSSGGAPASSLKPRTGTPTKGTIVRFDAGHRSSLSQIGRERRLMQVAGPTGGRCEPPSLQRTR